VNVKACPVSVRRGLMTPGVLVLLAVAMTGLGAGLYRFIFGLGAATNLSNQYPWGLWIGVDVASGVALAAGGFTSAAVAHIFHRHKYEALVRPALLTAMLGYTFAVLGLTADLGRYYNIWHPMLPGMWQGNSVLFEVAMCVTIYLNVLYLEFMPIVCERFIGHVHLPGPLSRLDGPLEGVLRWMQSALNRVMFVFIIAGVVLSCMHQSSLGSLLLIAPYKMNPLWYTPALPLLFLLSAMAAGFAMVVFESLLVSWTLERKPEMKVLTPYSRFALFFLGVYGAVRLSDFVIREAFVHLPGSGFAGYAFAAEIGLGIVLPFLLLLSEKVRQSPRWLLAAASCIVGGVLMNRVDVFLVAFRPPYAQTAYFPSTSELLVTIGLVAALVLTYRVCITVFPVLHGEEIEIAEVCEAAPAPAHGRTEPYVA
jgi:Ni/Fe-hydrogenase subunit HybB-like protein